ncbi:hypothetical protein [Devosia marina]|uniref:hypothetical protein n=1 Tax=Devosia marina TaxID=2683198 RepID=UPI0012F892A8|nr:hypothetical protein [Devosia marina]
MTLPEQAPELAAESVTQRQADATETRKGVVAALSAYLLWGFLPILFHLLDQAGSC